MPGSAKKDLTGWFRLLLAPVLITSTLVFTGVAGQQSSYASGSVPDLGTPVVITPDNSGGGSLVGVSCPSTTSCIAVGQDTGSPAQAIYSIGTESAGVWSWTPSATVTPDGSGGGALNDISCTSTTSCVAVGVDNATTPQSVYSYGTASNGSWTWATSTLITPDSSQGGVLFSVSCAGPSTCVAVGEDVNSLPIFSSGTLVGSTWSWTTEGQIPGGSGLLWNVDCISATTCITVGWNTSSPSQSFYSVGNESGGQWSWTQLTTVPANNSGGATITAVRCSSLGSCVAVGNDANGQAIFSVVASPPVAPTIGVATSGNGTAIVTWSANFNGGSAITGYTVNEVNVTTSTTMTDACPSSTSSPALQCTVSSLINGDTYSFSVAGINIAGPGTYSSNSNQVVPLPTVPGPPIIGVAPASSSASLVTWTAPVDDGGSVITGYRVSENDLTTASSVANACSSSNMSTTTSCTVTGLRNGDTYDFSVAAINIFGTGASSNVTNPVTPYATLPPAATDFPSNSSGNSYFHGVSCPSVTMCVAVGGGTTGAVYSIGTEVGSTWNWTSSVAVNPGSTQGQFFLAVSCPTTTSCVAVGTGPTQAGGAGGIFSSATYSGGTWTWTPLTNIVAASTSTGGALWSISCVSATTCVAVGGSYSSGATYTSGTESSGQWVWKPAQDFGYAPINGLGGSLATSVSCGSPTSCVALARDSGAVVYSSGTESGGNWTWTSLQPGANESPLSEFSALSCPSATMCIAVGALSGYAAYSIGTSSGNSWTWTPATPMAGDDAGANLVGVSCATTTSCSAVGGDNNGMPVMATGVATGGIWKWSNSTEVIPDSSGGGNFLGVSCPTGTSCVAIGSNTATSPQAITDAWSSALATVTGAPTIGTATSGPSSVTVTWTAPTNSGGSVITGYSVRAHDSSSGSTRSNVCPTSIDSADTSCVPSNLTAGNVYTFSVAAIDPIGISVYSSSSNAITASMSVGSGGGSGGGSSGSGGGSSGGGSSGSGGGSSGSGGSGGSVSGGGGGSTPATGPTIAPPPTGLPASDYGTPDSTYVSSNAVTDLNQAFNGSSVTVRVPTNALPPGTVVSVYPITNTSALSAVVPAGHSYVLSFAVSWETPANTTPTSSTPLALTITNASIKAGDTIYELTSAGPVAVGTATVNGSVALTFSHDPIFIVAESSLTNQRPLTITTRNGTVGRALTLKTSGGSGNGLVTFTVGTGSARRCSLTGHTLKSNSVGVCWIMANKAGTTSYSPAWSSPRGIYFSMPAIPLERTIRFVAGTNVLNSTAKSELRLLAKKLIPGAELTIYGYTKNDARLEKKQAMAIDRFIKRLRDVKVSLRSASYLTPNELTVVTKRQ